MDIASNTSAPTVVAGVDLGSNSFHMVVARLEGGRLHVVDKLKDFVRLASGLTPELRLGPDARERALSSLHRFGERLRGIPPEAVRAVGTNTLRKARDARSFLEEAEQALGHSIEIISGLEEARLIYLGVANSVAPDARRRLVIDIGGGSTECIIGQGFLPLAADSLYMGCVGFTQTYFSKEISREAFDRAEVAAGLELTPLKERYHALGFESAIGSSGTITAVSQVLRANSWSDGQITAKALKKLRRALIERGKVGKLSLAGLEPDRAPVFPGGVSILRAAFQILGIQEMSTSTGALREGLIYDLLGRLRHEDVRDETIRAVAARYHVEAEQGMRVKATAVSLLAQVASEWAPDRESRREAEKLLGWASAIHEIGRSIAYTGYQKHSAYILEHAEMPGFSREEERLLAAIVRNHRRKFLPEVFAGLPLERARLALRLAVLLRLAVALNRSRGSEALPEIQARARGEMLEIIFPDGWLEGHPLTREDLSKQSSALEPAGITLRAS